MTIYVDKNESTIVTMFYELPKDVQDVVYSFDPTYHVFNTENFQKEIKTGYFSLRSFREKANQSIEKAFQTLQTMGATWSGVSSYMQDGQWMYDEDYHHEWQDLSDNYDIYMCCKNDLVVFRLQPKLRWANVVEDSYDGIVRRDGKVELFDIF